MKPIDFKQRNVIFAKNHPEYLPLPAWRGPIPECEVISCWKLSLWERIKLLFTGVIWLRQFTFGQPLQPQLLEVGSPFWKDKEVSGKHN